MQKKCRKNLSVRRTQYRKLAYKHSITMQSPFMHYIQTYIKFDKNIFFIQLFGYGISNISNQTI